LISTHRAWAGANNRVRLAVVGIHGMGRNHLKAYNVLPDTEVAALCDIDENLFPEVIAKLFTSQNLRPPKTYTDIRKLLENKEIDAISVVTPNHWHTLPAIQEGFHSCELVHLGNSSYRLGRSLEFDPATMTFPHDPEASALLTRQYRPPFVVPENV
jgi:hypothetical protein